LIVPNTDTDRFDSDEASESQIHLHFRIKKSRNSF
jgi:hypothetical protein